MRKKPVRVSEKALSLAKQQLMIREDAVVSTDELITMLVMQNQSSKDDAQKVLDYMGDEFTQKVDGQAKPRLSYKKGHFYENGSLLGIDQLLDVLDRTPTDSGLSEVLEEVKALRNENAREHRRQFNMFNVYFSSLKLMSADILNRLSTKHQSAADVVAEVTLSDKDSAIVKGIDLYSFADARQKTSDQNTKRKANYDD